MPIPSYYRLPEGLVGLRLDFGARLRRYRRKQSLTQAELAERAGLGRETISRIESGKVQPKPGTLDEILRVLGLDMGKVAVRGRNGRTKRVARYFDGSERGDLRHEIGRAIRIARIAEDMSLRTLAERSGLSASQLSRIERGEGERSSVYKNHKDEAHLAREDRGFLLVNPELLRLAKKVLLERFG
ncbi:MAG: helix-turn-helix transcriptional regulator [Sphingomonas sp.]